MYIANCQVCGGMVVYADFEDYLSGDCPHCRRKAEEDLLEVDKKFLKMFFEMAETANECTLQNWARDMLTFDKDYRITLFSSLFNYNDENCGTLAKDFKVKVNNETNEIICLVGEVQYWFARYYSVKNFKAAIYRLKAAIERGDRSFRFPSDFDVMVWSIKKCKAYQ